MTTAPPQTQQPKCLSISRNLPKMVRYSINMRLFFDIPHSDLVTYRVVTYQVVSKL